MATLGYSGDENSSAMDPRYWITGCSFVNIIVAVASRSSLIIVIIVITAHFMFTVLSSWSFTVHGE